MDIVEALGGERFLHHVIAAFVFAMVVNIISAVVRKAVELIRPHLKNMDFASSRLWRELFLPILPVLVGALLALTVTSFPYPSVFTRSVVMRVMYGMLAGFFSTWAYRIIKTLVQRKWDVVLPEISRDTQILPPKSLEPPEEKK